MGNTLNECLKVIFKEGKTVIQVENTILEELKELNIGFESLQSNDATQIQKLLPILQKYLFSLPLKYLAKISDEEDYFLSCIQQAFLSFALKADNSSKVSLVMVNPADLFLNKKGFIRISPEQELPIS